VDRPTGLDGGVGHPCADTITARQSLPRETRDEFSTPENLIVNDHSDPCYLLRSGDSAWKEAFSRLRGPSDSSGSKIRGGRLYVDNKLLDVTNDLYANEDQATLVGVFGEED
jgi:hypothetical protein